MKKSGKYSVSRGKRGEREFRRLLQDHLGDLGVDMERNLDQTRDSGSDFICIPGWSVEVRNRSKVYEKWWMNDAIARALEGTVPVLVYRKPNRPMNDRWWVELRAADAIECLADCFTGEMETVHMRALAWFAIVRERWSEKKSPTGVSGASISVSKETKGKN